MFDPEYDDEYSDEPTDQQIEDRWNEIHIKAEREDRAFGYDR